MATAYAHFESVYACALCAARRSTEYNPITAQAKTSWRKRRTQLAIKRGNGLLDEVEGDFLKRERPRAMLCTGELDLSCLLSVPELRDLE